MNLHQPPAPHNSAIVWKKVIIDRDNLYEQKVNTGLWAQSSLIWEQNVPSKVKWTFLKLKSRQTGIVSGQNTPTDISVKEERCLLKHPLS